MLKKKFNNLLECNGKYYENFESMKKNNVVETFSLLGLFGVKGKNTVNIKDSKNISKKMQLDTNIDRSTVVKSCNKIINSASNEVAQSNSAEVSNSVAASNSMLLMNIKCDNFVMDGTTQDATTISNTNATIRQDTQNKISNSMENTISKSITSSLPSNENEIMNKQNKMLKQFMDATPGLDMNAAKKIVSGLSNDGFGNKTNVSSDYSLQSELKSKLKLNNSFKATSNNEVSNTIKNAVNQENFASCSNNAMAANNITLKDFICKTAKITNTKQKATAKATLNCLFDQKMQNEISNKVVSRLKSVFKNIQDASAKDENSQGQIAALALAVAENINNTAKKMDKKEKKEPKQQNTGSQSGRSSSPSYYRPSNNLNNTRRPSQRPLQRPLPGILDIILINMGMLPSPQNKLVFNSIFFLVILIVIVIIVKS